MVRRGTAVRAKALGRDDIGGKTGTTNEAKDAWFAGFHPTNATVVWMGFDQPEPMGRREYGGVAALPVWMDFMRAQLKDTPDQWVSINNRSKSKKQQQQMLEIADEDLSDTSESNKPVKTLTQQRKPTAPESIANTNGSAAQANDSRMNDSVPQNPLSVTPVQRIPPMPE